MGADRSILVKVEGEVEPLAPRVKVLKTDEPGGRPAGLKVANTAELVSAPKTAEVI